jgi:hypothetical protein
MKTTIYQIEQNYLQIVNQLIDNEGEITDELSEALQITQDQLQNKAVNYSFVIKQIDSDIEQIEAEVKRLNQLKKVQQNVIDRLKSTLTQAMQIFEVDEIKTPLIKINFRKSESVEVDDVNALPNDFKTIKVVETADKVKIKEVLKSGLLIEGCRILTNQNIQIK